MANEAVLVQDLEYRHLEVTMADGAAGTDIEKGTLLKLSDPTTGAASSADGDLFLGILLTENVGADGQTRYAVSRHGVWDIKDSGAGVTVGDMVKISGANLIATADDDQIEKHSEVVGMALQTGAADEVIEVLVGGF
jgi:hypothetical protein|tara:strand:+ start:2477 stop:2887 length:411 start_codon:yes stop_codon:yes gene_type:complete